MMTATGSALRYNLGGREVIAEEFPMAWALRGVAVMEKCHKSYLQPSKGDDQFERRLKCITDDDRRENGSTCTTVTSKELMSR